VNPVYRETFDRHRRLFLLPVVLAFVIVTWATLGAPSAYQSSTSVWSDAPGGSADVYGAPPPATQEQSMLNELLTTERFRKSVAENGGLALYLVTNPSPGWGPTAFLSKLRSAPTLDNRIAAALGPKRVKAAVEGPHVLKIDLIAPTPALATSTLRALVDTYISQRDALQADALTAYRNQVRDASAALGNARAGVSRYVREHPDRATRSDPRLAALVDSARRALKQLTSATQTVDRESTTLLSSSSGAMTLHVLDPPGAAEAQSGGLKSLLKMVFAGLFAGALVSILGIVAVAKIGRPAEQGERVSPHRGGVELNGEDGVHDQLDSIVTRVESFAQPRAGSR